MKRHEIEDRLHAIMREVYGERANSPTVRAYMREMIAKARSQVDAEYEKLAALVRAADPSLSKSAAGAEALDTDKGREVYENISALDSLAAYFAA